MYLKFFDACHRNNTSIPSQCRYKFLPNPLRTIELTIIFHIKLIIEFRNIFQDHFLRLKRYYQFLMLIHPDDRRHLCYTPLFVPEIGNSFAMQGTTIITLLQMDDIRLILFITTIPAWLNEGSRSEQRWNQLLIIPNPFLNTKSPLSILCSQTYSHSFCPYLTPETLMIKAMFTATTPITTNINRLTLIRILQLLHSFRNFNSE